jgi:hypothetical protein
MTTATPIRMAHETTDRPALLLAFELGHNQRCGASSGSPVWRKKTAASCIAP